MHYTHLTYSIMQQNIIWVGTYFIWNLKCFFWHSPNFILNELNQKLCFRFNINYYCNNKHLFSLTLLFIELHYLMSKVPTYFTLGLQPRFTIKYFVFNDIFKFCFTVMIKNPSSHTKSLKKELSIPCQHYNVMFVLTPHLEGVSFSGLKLE